MVKKITLFEYLHFKAMITKLGYFKNDTSMIRISAKIAMQSSSVK